MTGTNEKILERLKRIEREVERLRVKESGGTPTWADIVNVIYPVGAIYMSVNSANPNTLFGGTWVAWGTGRVPVGIDTGDGNFNTVEKTGGASTVTLTANQSGLRSHSHSLPLGTLADTVGYDDRAVRAHPAIGADDGFRTGKAFAASGGAGTRFYGSASLDNASATEAHSNLQPFIVCYMWKRTA